MSLTQPTNSSIVLRILALSIGLGAFLSFFVQPMIAKSILPYLGGSSAIWAISLVFFTSTLCTGYCYAYWISRFNFKKQVHIHCVLLGVSIASLCINTYLYLPIALPLDWLLDTASPTFSLLIFLITSIGVPYVCISATAPLLQQWFVYDTGREPYILYSISNVGSLAGLLAYPLLFEPYASLTTNAYVWFGIFIGYAIAVAYASAYIRPNHPVQSPEQKPVTLSTLIAWIMLTMLPAALLVAGTTYITQVVAPIPLLWIAPLAAYLVSFIIAFSGISIGPTVFAVAALSTWHTLNTLLYGTLSAQNEVYSLLTTMFLVSLCIHYYVYVRRPEKYHSSLFYVCTSFGGALGSTSVSLLAPLLLSGFFELHIILMIASVVLIRIAYMTIVRKSIPRNEGYAIVVIASIYVLTYAQAFTEQQQGILGDRSRNFYGVTRVYEDADMRHLYHGTTLHGEQFLDPAKSLLPTSYYSTQSGIGRAIIQQQAQHKTRGISVGVIGLGTGTLASYCRPQDVFTFYEIDERVVHIATNQFTFTKHCEHLSVHMGDGRVSLSKEKEPHTYDVLAVDAFSDDSIPMHLITREALVEFMHHVAQSGVLAIHTSNRYLNLGAVVARIAHEEGIPVGFVTDDGEDDGSAASIWILLAQNTHVLHSPHIRAADVESSADTPLWTDSYINIFPVLFDHVSLMNVIL